MLRVLMFGLVFVASINATCGDMIIEAFSETIKDRIAIIERVTEE